MVFFMQLHERIFPQLACHKWTQVNLNNEVPSIHRDSQHNGLLNPLVQEDFVKDVTLKHGAEFSYGGYMEDRSILWRGHYHDPHKMRHLGIDFNVPTGTPVFMPFYGEIIACFHDEDQNGGWGGRIDFYNHLNGFYFILAHLDAMTTLHTVGVNLGRGVCVGFIGNNEVNGGWYPHLHLQVVSKEEYKHKYPIDIDGYGLSNDSELEALMVKYPNPQSLTSF